MAALLLCAVLALACTAFAAEPEIVIRITPPHSVAGQEAAVEVMITDYTASGLRSAQVKAGSESWKDLILEQWENLYYGVVNVAGNNNVQVRITGGNGTVYEKSLYVQNTALKDWNGASVAAQSLAAVIPMKADVSGSSASVAKTPKASEQTVTESKVSTALTPDGQGTVVDNVTSENGKEFYTISTPNENTFYLVVDKEREGENVYFLNAVTESDLKALAEKDKEPAEESAVPSPAPVCTCQVKCAPGSINAGCSVCLLSMQDCLGTVLVDAGDQPEEPEKNSGSLFLILAVALAAGGAGYYFKVYKPKQELEDEEEFDDLTGEEEETVNEDEAEPVYGPYGEPEEPEWGDEG